MKKINKEPTQKQRKEIEKILFLLNDFFPFLQTFSKKQIKIINKTMDGNRITVKEIKEVLKEQSKEKSETFSMKVPRLRISKDKKVQFEKGEKMWQYVKNKSKKVYQKEIN